jgi:hypothetical protein
MFGFHAGTIHVSKDDAYDANNNVIRYIYQVPVIGDLNLEWKVNSKKFKIVAKNLPILQYRNSLCERTIYVECC